MVTRELVGGRLTLGRLVLGFVLGLGLFALGQEAGAQQYVGDSICGACHADVYATYIQHGHPWQEVATGGREPGPDLFGFASVGVGLPELPTVTVPGEQAPRQLTWADVKALVGNFMGGEGALVIQGAELKNGQPTGKNIGYLVEGTRVFAYPAQCFECHNPTGYEPTGTMYGISDWNLGSPASDAHDQPIQGVQCEHCHGPSATMKVPTDTVLLGLCRDCHSTTKKNLVTGVESDPNKRIPFAPTADGTTGVFTNHHPEGDEFRRSPHKAVTDKNGEHHGCVLCHEPHKSVWHDQGGIKFAAAGDEAGQDNMCKHCHQESDPNYPNAVKVRLRGAMGEIGVACVDCHMPEKTAGSAVGGVAVEPEGERHTHIFRINPTALAAIDNVTVVGTTKYWNSPGDPADPTNPTALNGDSFLTLDMVCTTCHDNMTREQMAEAAKTIHRTTEMLDLTVNGDDKLQIVKTTDVVTVAFSVDAGEKEGMQADWYVLSQGPRGYTSWDGKKWLRGLKPWRKGVPLADVSPQTVLKGKLAAGHYSYWLAVYPTDGSENLVSVPVYVSKPPKAPKPPRRTASRRR